MLTENGWTSEVAVDLPGRKVTFRATLERGEGSRLGLESGSRGDGNPVIHASYDAGSVQVEIEPQGAKRSFEVKSDAETAAPFFFENLSGPASTRSLDTSCRSPRPASSRPTRG